MTRLSALIVTALLLAPLAASAAKGLAKAMAELKQLKGTN